MELITVIVKAENRLAYHVQSKCISSQQKLWNSAWTGKAIAVSIFLLALIMLILKSQTTEVNTPSQHCMLNKRTGKLTWLLTCISLLDLTKWTVNINFKHRIKYLQKQTTIPFHHSTINLKENLAMYSARDNKRKKWTNLAQLAKYL